jgi:nicotinamide-nucleotide amidase
LPKAEAPGEYGSSVEDAGLRAASLSLFRALSERQLRLACAESCTGGLVTAALTDIPGSSETLWGGVAAYSNECKIDVLGVPRETIERYGAVSIEVARAMAEGILKASRASGDRGSGGADLGLAITGIAGPGGGSAEKPVGLVCFSWRLRSGEGREESVVFPGDRAVVRAAAARRALEMAAAMIASLPRR